MKPTLASPGLRSPTRGERQPALTILHPVPAGEPTRAASLPAALAVAILAGGLGTRLRPVVPDQAKTIAPVGGRPFLAWWLQELAQAQVPEVVLCTGYRSDQIRACLGESFQGMRLRYSVEPRPLGTGGALRHALWALDAASVIVFNGDSFCDLELQGFVRAHRAGLAAASLVITRVTDTSRFGRVVPGVNGWITEFQEKGAAQGPGWINAGIYLFERRLLSELPPDQSLSLERDLLPRWLGTGIRGYPAKGRFIDIGTPESFVQAQALFAGMPQAAA